MPEDEVRTGTSGRSAAGAVGVVGVVGVVGEGDASRLDPSFRALPLREMAQAALERARELGAEHADFRAERVRGQSIRLRDGQLDGVNDSADAGICVRVVHEGTWGFAA